MLTSTSGHTHNLLGTSTPTSSTVMRTSAATMTRTSTISTGSDLTTTLGNRATATSGAGVRRLGGRRPLLTMLRLGRDNMNYVMNCTSCGSATSMGHVLGVGTIGRMVPHSLGLV